MPDAVSAAAGLVALHSGVVAPLGRGVPLSVTGGRFDLVDRRLQVVTRSSRLRAAGLLDLPALLGVPGMTA
jgi:hypothetical protein